MACRVKTRYAAAEVGLLGTNVTCVGITSASEPAMPPLLAAVSVTVPLVGPPEVSARGATCDRQQLIGKRHTGDLAVADEATAEIGIGQAGKLKTRYCE